VAEKALKGKSTVITLAFAAAVNKTRLYDNIWTVFIVVFPIIPSNKHICTNSERNYLSVSNKIIIIINIHTYTLFNAMFQVDMN